MDRLKGKVALVTGAARGLGARIAQRMQEEGASVIRTDLKADGEVRALDVASEASWQETAAYVAERFGRLDVLVNNAGTETVALIADLSLDEWRRVMAVNSDGVFLGCKTMLPLLKAAGERGEGHASVVNISSLASRSAGPTQVCYSTSKAACEQFTRGAAIEFAALGYPIRVNSIHPAAIDSPLFRETMMNMKTISGTTIEEKIARMAASNPMNRVGDPDDIAWACVYLASNEAGFVNGHALLVDGGASAR